MDQQPSIDDLIKPLTAKQKVPIVALKKLLDEREAVDEQQEAKIQQIRKKYLLKIQPLLQRASQIIRGSSIKLDEVAGAQSCMKSGEKVEDYLKGKVIDGYWNGVFSNSALVDQITENDELALQSLLDIQQVENFEDPESIELKFVFKANSYFKEGEIKRKLCIKNGETLCLEGDKIEWKSGECLTHSLKKVTNKKTGEKSTIKQQKIDSFFDIFLDWDFNNREELARVSEMMTEISSLLIMDSVDYFLGVINADEESDDDDDQSEQVDA